MECERVQTRRLPRWLTEIRLSFPRLEHPDFVRRLLVRIEPAMVGSMKEIEASHGKIGVGDIVLFHRVCRCVDRV